MNVSVATDPNLKTVLDKSGKLFLYVKAGGGICKRMAEPIKLEF